MSSFITELNAKLLDDDKIWCLDTPLIYRSDFLKKTISVPAGFQTDFASVPRLPIIYSLYGDRAHREAVLHDYLYRIDSDPVASFSEANEVFFEAMELRGKPSYVRYPMWWAVCIGGKSSYHKLKVDSSLVRF